MKSPVISESTINSLTSLSEAKAIIRAQNVIIEQQAAKFEKIVSELNQRIVALEEKIANLSKTSINSSKPPSSDITKPKSQRRNSNRKKGGQPGHKGVTREFVSSDQVDSFIEIIPSTCEHCGSERLKAVKECKVEQRFELVEKPVLITQYNLGTCKCLNCGKSSQGKLPSNEVVDSPFGVRLQATASFLKARGGSSYTEVQEILDDCLGVKISTGALTEIVMRTSESLKPSYLELENAIKSEPCVYVDETSWKDDGVRYWLWTFCSATIAFFTLSRNRNTEVIQRILGKSFAGGVVSDFFSAYVSYGSVIQQFCLAHLIRDIKYCGMVKGRGNSEFSEKVLGFLRAMFELWHSREELTERQFAIRFGKIRKQLWDYLHSSRPCHKLSINLKKRMIRYFDSLFTFATRIREGVYEPTNNRSERTLRGAVRIRRCTQGTRGVRGQRWIERSMTVIETCKNQQRNTFQFFSDSLNIYYFGGRYPSLLPNKNP